MIKFVLAPFLPVIAIYLVAVNLIAFALMGYDKALSKTDRRRVPEATLFFFVVIGGSLGGTLGMYAWRHKTRHWYFAYGFPAILVIHVLLLLFLFLI
ncbi:MAG: DUF1294 domain-containing protein [Eubacteriaceae bacterium]|nr:DUF1294 domain-containing protein [Eubacteriaceae bacterium]MBR0383795.1 DUF1294 domain-containing protein [Eubacteriaceae bacterium]